MGWVNKKKWQAIKTKPLSEKEQRIADDNAKKLAESKLVVYAELSRKQYNLVASGEYGIELPRGIVMKNRAGNRGLYFYCQDVDTSDTLVEALDADDINWQYVD